ncbi:MAG: hypothetical protein GVY27_05090 [Deinococcus-Thermus bacterium]|jgi:YHS domain-containing protein|nr:hypothetical protein [Deinococcota bacterium]
MTRLLASLALALGLAVPAVPGMAGTQLPVAIGGYDAVSYHEDAPTPGAARFSHFWNGAVWYFASEENRDAFAASPAAFAPAYDGYCAFAAAKGYKAPGDPTVWRVVEGTLYLNVSDRAQELWAEDIPAHVAAADEVWPRIHPF